MSHCTKEKGFLHSLFMTPNSELMLCIIIMSKKNPKSRFSSHERFLKAFDEIQVSALIVNFVEGGVEGGGCHLHVNSALLLFTSPVLQF